MAEHSVYPTGNMSSQLLVKRTDACPSDDALLVDGHQPWSVCQSDSAPSPAQCDVNVSAVTGCRYQPLHCTVETAQLTCCLSVCPSDESLQSLNDFSCVFALLNGYRQM